MKFPFCILILVLWLFSCNNKTDPKLDNSTGDNSTSIVMKAQDTIILRKLTKLYITGDFDGDKQIDTVFEHVYSKLTKSEINYSADPYQNDWDSVINWFYVQKAELFIRTNDITNDTLFLGIAQGLYCLINIGDNNSDGKDEIAIVIDLLDFSRVNSCRIYSLCDKKWTLLKTFGIHEGSFDFISSEGPQTFQVIKESLENHDGKWLYLNYPEHDYKTMDEVGKMQPINLSKCE